jgi:hypothetical protein
MPVKKLKLSKREKGFMEKIMKAGKEARKKYPLENVLVDMGYEQGKKDEIEKAYEKWEEANTNYERYDVISQYWDWIEKERKRLKK